MLLWGESGVAGGGFGEVDEAAEHIAEVGQGSCSTGAGQVLRGSGERGWRHHLYRITM
ncbi:MAG: hypothetical protein NVSMB62_26410 [Acidobacteriaceae bacterium]